MLDMSNITLTSFLIAFAIGSILSIVNGNYSSAIGCLLTIGAVLPVKYYIWKKTPVQPTENKTQKVIVIKRK
jgi:apolipoprotein N-acyltransferase